MNIKDFVRITINNICDGIDEARTEQAKKRQQQVAIAPGNINGAELRIADVLKNIHFDLSVEVETNTEKDGKASLKVVSGEIKREDSERNTSRVKFDVPYVPAALTQFSSLADNDEN